MGCCSPNRERECEFINNSSQINKKSINENFASLFNNENNENFNILKDNQMDIGTNIVNEQNFEEKSEKIKLEKENNVEKESIKENQKENGIENKKEKANNKENEKEKEFDKEDSRFSLISSERNNTTKITNSDYENVISLYPLLTTENQDKIEVKKNIILENKSIYYGEFNTEKNIKEGRGILIWPNGAKYTGYFQNNMQNIKGKMYHIDGDIYEGEWLNNKANGEGKFIHKGIIYEGQCKDDKQN